MSKCNIMAHRWMASPHDSYSRSCQHELYVCARRRLPKCHSKGHGPLDIVIWIKRCYECHGDANTTIQDRRTDKSAVWIFCRGFSIVAGVSRCGATISLRTNQLMDLFDLADIGPCKTSELTTFTMDMNRDVSGPTQPRSMSGLVERVRKIEPFVQSIKRDK